MTNTKIVATGSFKWLDLIGSLLKLNALGLKNHLDLKAAPIIGCGFFMYVKGWCVNDWRKD